MLNFVIPSTSLYLPSFLSETMYFFQAFRVSEECWQYSSCLVIQSSVGHVGWLRAILTNSKRIWQTFLFVIIICTQEHQIIDLRRYFTILSYELKSFLVTSVHEIKTSAQGFLMVVRTMADPSEREELENLIEEWNATRLDMFAIKKPDAVSTCFHALIHLLRAEFKNSCNNHLYSTSLFVIRTLISLAICGFTFKNLGRKTQKYRLKFFEWRVQIQRTKLWRF